MLEVKNLDKKFKERVIFDNFALTVADGEILAIAGPSGGGKTTLLRMLAGLESIDSGTVSFDGKELEFDSERYVSNSPLGFVFQDFQLFPHMTVMENLTLSPIQTQNLSKAEADKKAASLLKSLGLDEEHAKAYPYSLSGGQKQRVALARAMMMDPQVIGYDEPTSALDPELRNQVADLILENKKLGITQIVVTHDLDFAEKIADNILKVNPRV
ncbi:MAG: amino acid ABC transporter ATP-binding protein [Streptococcaceae bacterium]|jgi:polar amino acid transport system ATP-binding protein|nr:amino acid ABC transporter ATP-binding protein [Streptococcaceae bacterium]